VAGRFRTAGTWPCPSTTPAPAPCGHWSSV
jgi:hypothetical protein